MIRPQPGPQERFLSIPPTVDIAIYGGAAGGGKTWALLLEPLYHVDNPGFGAVIFRRTFSEIRQEGGMWEESEKIYPNTGAQPSPGKFLWTFSSGARTRFAYLQHEKDKFAYQGAQISLLAFDQLEHFSKSSFFYMLSRNRSLCGVRPYVRATCNPDADSWLAGFLSWWIAPDGYADPDRAGKVRYFIRVSEELEWADDAEMLLERHAGYLSGLDADPRTLVKSAAFMPANVYDNKILLERNPEYLANLLALPLVDRERLLKGNWKVRAEAGKLFNRAWFSIVPGILPGGVECRFWDFGATEKKLKGDDPDFTAGVKMRLVKGTYCITDCVAERLGPADADRLVLNLAQQDRAAAQRTGTRYMVRWEIEPGASGKRDDARLRKMLAGFDAAGVRPQGDKVTRAKPLAAQSEIDNVKLVEGDWNERWLTHMHHQPDFSHDDIMDASSGAFNALTETGWVRGMV